MADTDHHFLKAPQILFDTLSLDDLQALLLTDKASRTAASRAIFARNDGEALQLQENLLAHWLDSSASPPFDISSLKAALKRADNSLHYKLLCLLLMQQLKKEKPVIDTKELLKSINQGLVSQNRSPNLAALQAIPFAVAITKASLAAGDEQISLGDWDNTINEWVSNIHKLLLARAREARGKPFRFSGLNKKILLEIAKTLLFLGENTPQKDIRGMAYAISWQYLLFPSSMGKQLFITFLKKHNSEFKDFIILMERSINHPFNKLPEHSLSLWYQDLNSTNPETLKNAWEWVTELGAKTVLPELVSLLLESPQLNAEERDKLIDKVILSSLKGKNGKTIPTYLQILDAIIPKLSKKQVANLFANMDFELEKNVFFTITMPELFANKANFLVRNLPNLFKSPHLTEQQMDRLTTILTEEIDLHHLFSNLDIEPRDFFKNFFSVLPNFFLNASPEQKNLLIAQIKAICSHSNFWSKVDGSGSMGCFELLPLEDFAEVFTTIYNQFPNIEKIILILPELLSAPQLTQEQFKALLEKLGEHLRYDDSEDMGNDFLLAPGFWVSNIFDRIFQSSHLSREQYSSWFNKLLALPTESLKIKALPQPLNSRYLTDVQFNLVINLVCQPDFAFHSKDEYNEDVSRTFSSLFASPKLTEQQFTSLVATILQWPPRQETLALLPTILQSAKTKATATKTKEQLHSLLEKVISEFKTLSVDDERLERFLYNSLVTAELVNNPGELESLVGALSSNAESSLVLQNFLCHLVISNKITATDLHSLSTKYSLSNLVPIFVTLNPQQLMQSTSNSTNRHPMFTSQGNNQQKGKEEDPEKNAPPRKKTQGPG